MSLRGMDKNEWKFLILEEFIGVNGPHKWISYLL